MKAIKDNLIKHSCGNTVLEGKGCTNCWKSLCLYKTDKLCVSDNWEKDRGVRGKCKICWSGILLPRTKYCSFFCSSLGVASLHRRLYYKNKLT